MEAQCEWCGSPYFNVENKKVFWELPDGSRAIEIKDTPTICCTECEMAYQSTEVVKAIEDQLFLINTKVIEKTITYKELMEQPRLLKRNYFDFSDH
ncbi:YokU family protein [Neobacillus sp. PS3-34]|uniref:YokU family protein n=1 Tax=Neobacillus sp. PS3-34 TaxID=3070678 RepID=UPI0027E1B5B0|nr:YokU family protein [Neobacillus sp. PS3-34]WML47853.1 YokU family protein [Neobacillus sp. PS3-34]